MKIQWNQVTWYSKVLALVMLIALPFAGFYFGTLYQKAISPVETGTTATTTKTSNNSVIKNPSPGALNIKDVLANVDKYLGKKIKVTARIDIHTGNTDLMCPQNNASCEQFQGTIFLRDISKSSAGENEELVLAEKSRTYPSTYNQLSCKSAISPIKTCLNYHDGDLTELEGTFVRQSSESPTNTLNLLVI